MDVLGNALLFTSQELHSLFTVPSLREVLKQCLNSTSIFNFHCTHRHRESSHPRCPGSRNWGEGQGEGVSWYKGCGSATDLLLDLLADVWRALHGNTSKQKTQIPCLEQAGSWQICFVPDKEKYHCYYFSALWDSCNSWIIYFVLFTVT